MEIQTPVRLMLQVIDEYESGEKNYLEAFTTVKFVSGLSDNYIESFLKGIDRDNIVSLDQFKKEKENKDGERSD